MRPSRTSHRSLRAREVSRRRRGFTLIELIVVIAIIGVAATVVAPAFRPRTPDARTTTDAIVTLYAAASSAATVRLVPVTVVVELATGRFVAVATPAAGTAGDTIDHGTLPLPAGAKLDGGREGWALTSFDAHGNARGSTIEITQEQQRYEVRIDPWTAEAVVRRR